VDALHVVPGAGWRQEGFVSAPEHVWVVVDAHDRPRAVRATQDAAMTERVFHDIYAHTNGPYAVVRYARVLEAPA